MDHLILQIALTTGNRILLGSNLEHEVIEVSTTAALARSRGVDYSRVEDGSEGSGKWWLLQIEPQKVSWAIGSKLRLGRVGGLLSRTRYHVCVIGENSDSCSFEATPRILLTWQGTSGLVAGGGHGLV